MRILRVRVLAFGPLREQVLDLAPGMTVIHGPNESGKSNWHAAIYAALCGLRRGRGRGTKDDTEFEARFRPWDGKDWQLAAEVELADGRRVEVKQDLATRLDCSAMDVVLGRDVSAEIIFDGSPDGSRWLGLDRRAFLSTACVRQAEVLQVLEDAGQLQEHLQRAAATAGTDATAAGALQLIETALSEKVGLDRRGSIRPLRLAIDRVDQAKQRLEAAQNAHREYLSLLAQAEETGVEAERAELAVREVEAAVSLKRSRALADQLTRAEHLAAKYPGGPPELIQDQGLTDLAAEALTAWQRRPPLPELSAVTAEQIRSQLDSLPQAPEGDREIHPSISQAIEAYSASWTARQAHENTPPAEPEEIEAALSPSELLDLAARLEEAPPPPAAARVGAEHLGQAWRRPILAYCLLATSGLLVVAAVAVAALRAILPAAALAGLALAVGAGGLVQIRRHSRRTLEEFQAADSAQRQAAAARATVERRREEARRQLAAHGLTEDPALLRRLSARVEQAERQRLVRQQWELQRQVLSDQLGDAARGLREALAARRAEAGQDVVDTYQRYVRQCRTRDEQARLAARRGDLEHSLQSRLELETAAAQAAEKVRSAEDALRSAAEAVGIDAHESPDALVTRLADWQRRHAAAQAERQHAINEWAELEALLGGRTLDELEQEASRSEEAASARATGLDPAQIDALTNLPDLESEMAESRETAGQAAREASRLHGQVERAASAAIDVAGAEEELSSAEVELARVKRLGGVLDAAKGFLEKAQERVHRDIAPHLAATLRDWLPKITAGRWLDAMVDPQTLQVTVRDAGGQWRDARHLSAGTCEQVYLLLRMAMVNHLVRAGECAPLILDDVTVHSDPVRKRALLELLLTMSDQRQVILFAQEDEVRLWAEAWLHAPQHTLRPLDAPSVPI